MLVYLFTSCTTQNFCNQKILHLSFHKGTIKDFEGVFRELGYEVTSWYILDSPSGLFDPGHYGSCIYNITHDRAQRIWEAHKDYFNQFDLIMTSDTAPLSRIFLQNNWTKPLLIWISNRFDYSDQATLDGKFPDREYYDLINQANQKKHVKIVANCEFEHYYARSKGVDTGSLVIQPFGSVSDLPQSTHIPETIDKERLFFLPPYSNEHLFLQNVCNKYGIQYYCGSFAHPAELADFKGIIHLPYSYSTIALYMNMSLGIPYFIPSPIFLKKLLSQNRYWHQDQHFLSDIERYQLSEWYSNDKKDVIVYFDSWQDLKNKLEKADYELLQKKVIAHSKIHKEKVLTLWRTVLQELFKK